MDFKQRVRDFVSTLKTIIGFIVGDIVKKPRTFKIGLFSIYIVVAFLIILESVLKLTPSLFLKIAEDQAGQADFVFAPASQNAAVIPTINLTEIALKTAGLSDVEALAPRWTFPVNVSRADHPNKNYRAIGIVLNSKYERMRGIGGRLDIGDLGYGKCWISKSLGGLMDVHGNRFILLYL